MSKIFLDTNILIYSIDKKEPSKLKKARKILKNVVIDHHPVISTQVIQEFYVVATTKLKADASAEKAKCEFIFSEDLASGATYRGVAVWNPFEEKNI